MTDLSLAAADAERAFERVDAEAEFTEARDALFHLHSRTLHADAVP
jgi:hypothetical protein